MEQLRNAKLIWEQDRRADVAPVWMPGALERKNPRAGFNWGWQWVFPMTQLSQRVC